VPKHLDRRLVTLRDPKLRNVPPEELEELARGLTDRNIRIFAEPPSGGGGGGTSGGTSGGASGGIHAMSKDFHAVGDDPFVLFDQLPPEVRADGSHAFYLGFEMAKALTALTLHKNYTQDQALNWGFLTREEVSHHERRKGAKKGHTKGGDT
jgi:hypothetical protein